MKKFYSLVICSLLFGPLVTNAGETPAPEGAAVYFINIKDGDTISTKQLVQLGARGIGVAPALVEWPNTGHHHIIIDAETPDFSKPIPNDANHRHFGGGQTEFELELAPGEHTLQLIMGDHAHVPHNPPVMSERIKVNVN